MKSYRKAVTTINQVILNENIEFNYRCELLELKKEMLYGKVDHSKGLKDLPFYSFYKKYSSEISCWLNEPEEEIKDRIRTRSFSEIENKLIITNILIKESGDEYE